MTDMQIKMAAYLYLAGILVDLVWEILKIIGNKEYFKKITDEFCNEIPLKESTIKTVMAVLLIVLLALYSGAWPISMHLDIWKKKKIKGES